MGRSLGSKRKNVRLNFGRISFTILLLKKFLGIKFYKVDFHLILSKVKFILIIHLLSFLD